MTLRGEQAAVVLSAKDYDALKAGRPTIGDDLLLAPPWDDCFANGILSGGGMGAACGFAFMRRYRWADCRDCDCT